MARNRKNIEFEETVEDSGQLFSFRDIIDGNLLTRKIVLRQARFVVLLVLIAFISIANRNHAEKVVIRLNQLQHDVKELRSQSITISADLIRASRQSEVVRRVNRYELELEENLEPPKKLVIKQK